MLQNLSSINVAQKILRLSSASAQVAGGSTEGDGIWKYLAYESLG